MGHDTPFHFIRTILAFIEIFIQCTYAKRLWVTVLRSQNVRKLLSIKSIAIALQLLSFLAGYSQLSRLNPAKPIPNLCEMKVQAGKVAAVAAVVAMQCKQIAGICLFRQLSYVSKADMNDLTIFLPSLPVQWYAYGSFFFYSRFGY